jgi:hypothetical protein
MEDFAPILSGRVIQHKVEPELSCQSDRQQISFIHGWKAGDGSRSATDPHQGFIALSNLYGASRARVMACSPASPAT